MPLDTVDLTLITALQADASKRLDALGAMVGLAPSSVHDRLRRLERDGVLLRWTIDVDAVAAFGLGVLAFIGVRSTKPCSEMISALTDISEIEECHSVAGDLSLLLKVRVASTPSLLHLVERLRQIPGVEQTETTIVLKTQLDRPISPAITVAPKKRRERGA